MPTRRGARMQLSAQPKAPFQTGDHRAERLVTRYATNSVESADKNQRRIEAVFEELAESKPDNVTYLVFRLADDFFVHVSFHNHSGAETNPISNTKPFAHFQLDHADRRSGPIDQQIAELVGAYITEIG